MDALVGACHRFALLVAAAVTSMLGVTGVPASAGTVPRIGVGLGQARPLPVHFFGVNFDYGGPSSYPMDPSIDAELAALSPGTLRWPGGNSADTFQWQQGRPSVRAAKNFSFTLGDLASAYRATGATPVFDLNVMTSTLADQEDMLRAASGLGLPIRYVELGNEFYLSNAAYVKAFPTAADYGTLVASAVVQLHRLFPGVEVAAVGSMPSKTVREKGWNQQVLESAQGHGGLPDALTLHVYPDPLSGDLRTGKLPWLFKSAYHQEQEIRSTIGSWPDAPPDGAWITEYDLRPRHPAAISNPAQTTYAGALFVAALTLMQPEASRVRLLDFWTSLSRGLGGDWSGAGTVPKLTPAGLAQEWIARAAAGSAGWRPLTFTGGPRLSNGDPDLIGSAFTAGAGSREVVVNLGGGGTALAAGEAVPRGAPFRQVTGDPVVKMTAASQLSQSSGRVGSGLTLPAYSITLIG
ncbi:MAG TPA: hypothetical protein VIA06_19320 [Candidatus Dormibacteraeota bacterium]|jgi:hypothetical protein|nr:hypothetical protein [Candidatus Dormibacteraeota bacterium]